MFSGLLQDWTTFDGAGTAAFPQPRPDWLDLAAYADVVFWLEVRAVANPGAGNVVLTYETAPAMDESLFQPLGAVTLVAANAPVLTEIKLAMNPAIPLARYVRWRLAGTAAGNWSVTFRVHTMANKGSPGVLSSFDPATLALSGWWRASYAGAPWTATASAGVSGTTGDLVAGVAPSTGTAQNGYVPALFDGSTNVLTNATLMSTLFTASAGSIVALFNGTSAAAPTFPYTDPPVFADTDAGMGLTFTTAGITAFQYDGAYETATDTFEAGVYNLVRMRWDGTNLGITVNSAAEVTTACGDAAVLTGSLLVGQAYGGTPFLSGSLLELMMLPSVLSDADYANIKGYCNARYGLSL